MNAPDSGEQDVSDMARLNAGHDAALNAIMDRHSERLFHYLIRQLGDETEAADVAQETFARVYLHRARYDPGQKFSTWLYTIATNLVRDRFRWRQRHPQVSLDAENEGTETGLKDSLRADDATPDERMQSNERAAAVREAVAALPEELRQPLILAVYQGMSQAEIGAILKCSVKAVETRIYRARQHLRTVLAQLLQTP